MRVSAGARCALAVFAAATVTACGGRSSPNSAMLPKAPQARGLRQSSGISPTAATQDLLYVSGNGGVSVFSYPQGKWLYALQSAHFFVPTGECVDAVGDVFITDLGANAIFEYRHGGKRLVKTLRSAAGDPNGCAIDPTTGNLAVSSLGRGSKGNVAIYPDARGKPTTYSNPNIQEYFFCGYDPRGNLYVDGTSHNYFALAELRKGGKKLAEISLDHKLDFPGGVQWHGTYVAVGDQTSAIYHFEISGSKGTLVGTTHLDGTADAEQFWIQEGRVIAGEHLHHSVRYWNYPAGGKPTQTIRRGLANIAPIGVVVSVARR